MTHAHDHAAGHDHPDRHHHVGRSGQSDHHAHAQPRPAPASLLRLSAGARLGGVAAALALLWGVTLWALS